jgi:hypothetical protein
VDLPLLETELVLWLFLLLLCWELWDSRLLDFKYPGIVLDWSKRWIFAG